MFFVKNNYLCTSIYKLIKYNMARKVDYSKRAEKIKAQIDELVQEINGDNKPEEETPKKKLKLIEIDFEGQELNTLLQIQARLSRVILDKSKE